MKALILNEIHQPVTYADYAFPDNKNEDVLVQIKAAALNHRDVWITKGMYPGIVTPIILGSDGVGIFEGQEVIINPSINWGDNPLFPGNNYEILGLPTNGTFAEYLTVNKKQLHAKPAHLNWEEAAALPLAGLTAYRALITKAKLQKGENVLISGIGGGVALFAFQFAVALGANVYVTSGHDDKIKKAIQLGAKGGVNYKNEDWGKELKSISGGFDVIIDSAGGEGFSKLAKCCNPGARMCMYGGTLGSIKLSPQLIFWKQISVMGTSMGSDQDFVDMLNFVNEHQIKPVVDSVYDLKDGQLALDKMDMGKQFGKIVLRV